MRCTSPWNLARKRLPIHMRTLAWTLVRTLATSATLTLVCGCGGSGVGLDFNGNPISSADAAAPLTADFDSIQTHVFTPICTVCHIGANAPQGLQLDAKNSYALLVGVASAEVPTLQRVHASDPTNSYLLQKIIGSAAVGQRMPFGGPYLPQATIDVIRQWIANGAQRSTSANALRSSVDSPSSGLQVVTTSPVAESAIDFMPQQIVIGFDRDLDSTLVNDTTVQLTRVADTAETGEISEPIAARLRVPDANARTLLVTPQSALVSGRYLLRLRGSEGVALAGLDALPLNSKGDGASGEDATIAFTVRAQP